MADSIEVALWVTWISGREYLVSILRSPHGLGTHRFVVPENSSLLTDLDAGPGEGDRDLRRPAAAAPQSPLLELREQGEELFRLVFAGENREPFKKCFDEAVADGAWLRLRLTFQKAPAAADWPWEAMVVEWTGNFLADLPRVSFERTIGLARSAAKPPSTLDGALRMLIVGASPTGLTAIGVVKERRRIAAVFKKAEVPIKVLTATNRAELDKAAATPMPFDIVHVICHGDFEGNEGGLWLEGDRREGSRLTSRELSPLLRRPGALVFLNACHSARGAQDPFAGLAETLLLSGTAAVVAMRRQISDAGAIKLASDFYSQLAAGETVAHSLGYWRTVSSFRNDGDWAVPVLYLTGDDFSLLPPRAWLPIGKLIGPKIESTGPAEPEAVPALRPIFEQPDAQTTVWSLPRKLLVAAGTLAAILALWIVGPFGTAPVAEPVTLMSKKGSDPPAAQAPTLAAPAPTEATVVAGSGATGAAKPSIPRVDPTEAQKRTPTPPVAGPPDSRCPSTRNPGIDFVFIPRGTFLQGNDKGKDEEKPAHLVDLSLDFCLGKFEVTRAQYATVLGRPKPAVAEANLPMAEIRWDEVQHFLQILNAREPKAAYRLPTDAQWEFAARAGTTTRYSFGEDAALLVRYGNCLSKEGSNDGHERAAPVGSYRPNPWGLHDMHGNVWELVEDYWSFYSPERVTDPRGPGRGAARVRRGGAYDAAVENCRSSTRQDMYPNRRQKTVGFRIARTPVR